MNKAKSPEKQGLAIVTKYFLHMGTLLTVVHALRIQIPGSKLSPNILLAGIFKFKAGYCFFNCSKINGISQQ